MKKRITNEHAKALSALGAAKGGNARAAKLSAEERKEIARKAAETRWANTENSVSKVPRETHSGSLKIGSLEIPCSVLEDGTRIFSTRGFNRALGSTTTGTPRKSEDGARKLPYILASESIKSRLSSEIMARLMFPKEFRPKHGGRTAFGHEATLLPDICGAILDADRDGDLDKRHKNIVRTAEALLRGFAHLGIIALVDEATGYQETRAKDELSKILEAYIAPELMPWTRMFPEEFFKQVYRLQGWAYKPGTAKRPQYVGKLIIKYVYEQLPPGVLPELRRLNPVTENGYRKHKFFQFLTADTGNVHLDRQITAVVTIMRISDSKEDFENNFNKAFATFYQQRLPLVLDAEPDKAEGD